MRPTLHIIPCPDVVSPPLQAEHWLCLTSACCTDRDTEHAFLFRLRLGHFSSHTPVTCDDAILMVGKQSMLSIVRWILSHFSSCPASHMRWRRYGLCELCSPKQWLAAVLLDSPDPLEFNDSAFTSSLWVGHIPYAAALRLVHIPEARSTVPSGDWSVT